MTLPDERFRAVNWAREFLQGIAYDKERYPRVSKNIRGEAKSILRHFPSSWDMERAARCAPSVFQEKMEPVTRLITQYEQTKELSNEA